MPYATNQAVKIFYEVEGNGSPIAFIHGATGNRTSWRSYGYVDRLKDKHRLILIDARGHGESDKPHAVEAYHYRAMVEDVIAVLDDLQIQKSHFWGYSLGGTIGFGLAKHYPERIHSLILGGCSPFHEDVPETEPPNPVLQAMRTGIIEGPDAVVRDIRNLFGEITPGYEARLRSLDYQAMTALIENLSYHTPGFEDVLPTMTMPCLIYMADGDDPEFVHTKSYINKIPNATLLELRGYNHVNANTNLDAIVPAVLKFLATGK
jgi:pimeloyl-ACP methyl ester carboxylesterase